MTRIKKEATGSIIIMTEDQSILYNPFNLDISYLRPINANYCTAVGLLKSNLVTNG